MLYSGVPLSMLLVMCASSLAQQPADVIEAGSQATAAVEVLSASGEMIASGSAFCIQSSGAFITNAHVVQTVGVGGVVSLVLRPGQAGQQHVRAKVENIGEDIDLALLKTNSVTGLQALILAKQETLPLTDEVTTFGFPLGTRLAVGRYPNVAVTKGRVSALRTVGDRLVWVEFDARVLPGNSGGPLLDKEGMVVGVVTANLGKYYKDLRIMVPTGINLAIPLRDLVNFLATPRISFDPPALNYSERARPVELTAQLFPTDTARILHGFHAKVTIAAGPNDQRDYQSDVPADGICKIKVVPIDSA
jgi:S1-C subfamily serine protease